METWKEELSEDLAAQVRDAMMGQLPPFVTSHRLATLGKKQIDGEYVNEAVPTDRLEDAEVITSWTGEREDVNVMPGQETPWSLRANMPETYHRPVLDLDMAAVVIPSTTPGHGHLYIDKVLTWSQYAKLLDVLAEVGIIEEGYRQASYAREFTSVRLPWVTKPLDAERAGEVSL